LEAEPDRKKQVPRSARDDSIFFAGANVDGGSGCEKAAAEPPHSKEA